MELQEEHWFIRVELPSYDSKVLRLLGIPVSEDERREEIFIPAATVGGTGCYMCLADKGLTFSEQPTEAMQEAVRTFEAGLPPAWAWRLAKAIVELQFVELQFEEWKKKRKRNEE